MEVSDSSTVVFDTVTLDANAGSGVHVLGAPGLSNLDDVAKLHDFPDYGFTLQSSTVTLNEGQGVHLGDGAEQIADVAALLDGNLISGNLQAGILAEQALGLIAGSDCGASAGQPGCTGATIGSNTIRDNGGAGVELDTAFIVPLHSPPIYDLDLGFFANDIARNASPGALCNSAQAVAQVYVTGPVGLANATCAPALDAMACNGLNTVTNNHCSWAGSSCQVAWDLRGGTVAGCASGATNAIYGYNASDFGNPTSVAIRAVDSAAVLANFNEYASATAVQNFSTSGAAAVSGDVVCGVLGCPP